MIIYDVNVIEYKAVPLWQPVPPWTMAHPSWVVFSGPSNDLNHLYKSLFSQIYFTGFHGVSISHSFLSVDFSQGSQDWGRNKLTVAQSRCLARLKTCWRGKEIVGFVLIEFAGTVTGGLGVLTDSFPNGKGNKTPQDTASLQEGHIAWTKALSLFRPHTLWKVCLHLPCHRRSWNVLHWNCCKPPAQVDWDATALVGLFTSKAYGINDFRIFAKCGPSILREPLWVWKYLRFHWSIMVII